MFNFLKTGTMEKHNLIFRAALLLTLSLLTVKTQAQVKNAGNAGYQPVIGQGGKDVVWVPTPQILVDKMLEMAEITPADFLVDLGSGDGRTVITAAKRGTRSIGIEYNPDMVALSKANAIAEGVDSMTEFHVADLFEYDFTKATVVTMFLLSDINLRLRPQLLEMKPGTRIVSNTFTMGDWPPDRTETITDEPLSWNTAYLWIVPANAEGKWRLQSGGELIIVQKFQRIAGEILNAATGSTLIEGKLNGYKISFTAGSTTYHGTLNGNKISGTATNGSTTTSWSATR